MDGFDSLSQSILIFAPTGRDGPACAEVLRRGGLTPIVCAGLEALVAHIEQGTAAVVLAEEGLFGRDLLPLATWVQRQPPWSDLPFVVLTSRLAEQPAVAAWRRRLIDTLRNVSLLERPVQAITLCSAAQTALRARLRQYEVRALLEAQARNAQQLEQLVRARTRQLEEANQALRMQMEQRARIEESLRQAQRIEAIGQLTGGIAHDFNNLLMVIGGGLDMLARPTEPARRQKLMDGMRQAAARGSALTRQLLAFSRSQPLQAQPVDPALQIGGMRELLDRSLRGDVQVSLQFPDDLWPVEVDPAELELSLLNLTVNARDAMPAGGTIIIRAENLPARAQGGAHGDRVGLSVIDAGSGMPSEIKARVFEPFFTTKEIGKGSGLGLAQVYGFAKQSGGSVGIDSEIGRGTTVTLFLPRSRKTPAAAVPHPERLDVERHDVGCAGAILLVEDDDEVAALVGEMLGQLGYAVTRVASAEAALGALGNGRVVDLVFSDVMMPGSMDGVALAREIRARRSGLPVLLTSGYAEAALHSAEAAGVRILPKPYRQEDLSAALRLARYGEEANGAAGGAPGSGVERAMRER